MIIYPAIDIRNGQVVRLTQGDYSKTTTYASDPPSTAADFKTKGATHLHIVDLDGALHGTLSNFEIIRKTSVQCGLFTQVGGGIRNIDRVAQYIDSGISRVIIGTAAIKDPEFLKTALDIYGDKIAVGVDARNGRVSINGWQQTTDISSIEFCKSLSGQGVSTIIYTDISKDGMLSGPNHEVYSKLSEITGLNIIASGGVSDISDVKRLAQTGIHGAIIGKALYTGAIDLAEAVSGGKA